MGFRFRKSFKIAPGIRLNLNKKSVGLRIGGKGAGISLNSKGRVTKTVGIPGTGLYYTDSTQIGGKKKGKKTSPAKDKNTQPTPQPEYISEPAQDSAISGVSTSSDEAPTPPQKKSSKKKKIIIAAVIAFVVLAIASSRSGSEETTATTAPVTTENTSVMSATELTTEITTETTTQAEPKTEAPTQRPTQSPTKSPAKTPSTTAKPKSQPAKAQTYMLNENTGKYHLASCRTIQDSKNLREISAEEAKNYTPCKVCKP